MLNSRFFAQNICFHEQNYTITMTNIFYIAKIIVIYIDKSISIFYYIEDIDLFLTLPNLLTIA